MRKLLALMIMVGVLLTINSGVIFAERLENSQVIEVSVKLNDGYLLSDTQPVVVDETVYVVGRYLVEALGGEIEWVEETATVRMTLEDQIIEVPIGGTEGRINGTPVAISKAPFIKDNRTMIPLRFVSEHFGCEVTWIQKTYTVNIIKEGLVVPEEYIYERSYTDEDLYLLSKIVTVESGDTSLEMALAIANTILNRVKDDRFPNTIEGVIYQVDVYQQFPPAHKSSFETLEPKPISIIASKKALEGVNNIGQSLFFNNQPFKSKKNDLIKIIDGEYFYK